MVVFGWRAGPKVCQSFGSQITNALRLEGHHAYLYMDDHIGFGATEAKANECSDRLTQLLDNLSVDESATKSTGTRDMLPVLGLELDLRQKIISTTGKLQRAKAALATLRAQVDRGHFFLFDVEVVCGKLEFVAIAAVYALATTYNMTYKTFLKPKIINK